ncbi:MAG: hypothetical protein ACPHF3_15505 [Pseudomonadales bacterium]
MAAEEALKIKKNSLSSSSKNLPFEVEIRGKVFRSEEFGDDFVTLSYLLYRARRDLEDNQVQQQKIMDSIRLIENQMIQECDN